MSAEQLNASAVEGEKFTGYEGPEGGRFACGNCKYFDAVVDGCWQKDMMEKSKRPRLKSGKVEVDSGGCCAYIERK